MKTLSRPSLALCTSHSRLELYTRFRSTIQAMKTQEMSLTPLRPTRAGSRPTRGTSRRLCPPSPGASRPHLGHLTPGQAVPTRGLTREAPGVPQGGPPRGYCATYIRAGCGDLGQGLVRAGLVICRHVLTGVDFCGSLHLLIVHRNPLGKRLFEGPQA